MFNNKITNTTEPEMRLCVLMFYYSRKEKKIAIKTEPKMRLYVLMFYCSREKK